MRSLSDILNNFHWVVPGEAARAAQVWLGRQAWLLARHDVKAIINLRGRNDDLSWWKAETSAAAARGAAHFDAMLDSRKLPTRQMLVQLMDAFDQAPRPFLLKCSGGQDRTSLAAALYLLHTRGWEAMDDAMAQFARFPYLHFPKTHQRWLAQFPAFARESAKGAPLAAWIAQSYSPEILRDWLNAKGMGDFYAGIFTVPTRSPHQW